MQTDVEPRHSRIYAINTFLIAAACSVFFCSKGVFIKKGYLLDTEPITLLALRMGYALPFFLIAGWLSHRSVPVRLTARHWMQILGLGFVGYYLSSLVNFAGLQHISVGLERMILFTYPSLVVLLSAIFLRGRIGGRMIAATVIAYAGIVTGFVSEAAGSSGSVLKGSLLVFTSAFTYAIFILCSGGLIRDLGSIRFASLVVGASSVMVVLHYLAQHEFQEFFALPGQVHAIGLTLAIAGTVIPSFLMGIGLERAGPQKFAVIGTVGPLATLFLAWLVLDEEMTGLKIFGFALAMLGGLMASLLKAANRG